GAGAATNVAEDATKNERASVASRIRRNRGNSAKRVSKRTIWFAMARPYAPCRFRLVRGSNLHPGVPPRKKYDCPLSLAETDEVFGAASFRPRILSGISPNHLPRNPFECWANKKPRPTGAFTGRIGLAVHRLAGRHAASSSYRLAEP